MSAPPLPDYFELLRQMTGLGGGVGAPPGAVAGTAFDPVEIDKKIRELQTVSGWLHMQANAVEMSIKALEYQRDTLNTMSQHEPGNLSADDMARFAAAFDPAQWMKNIMPAQPSGGKSNKKTAAASVAPKPKSKSPRRR